MQRDIITIGASSGGLEAFKVLVSHLPADLRASLFFVWHMPDDALGILGRILERHTTLPVRTVTTRSKIEPGTLYVASPSTHMIIERDYVFASKGPKENRFRPAIDPLFRSASLSYGSQVVGVVLTGQLDDGAHGSALIKSRGGRVVVQDPMEAAYSSMPKSVMRAVEVDHAVPISEMAELLTRLSLEECAEGPTLPRDPAQIENFIAEGKDPIEAGVTKLGDPSFFTCPQCHGVLSQLRDKELARFRCHTGHSFTLRSLLSELNENVEATLWNSLRSIQEQRILLDHLRQHVESEGDREFLDQLQQARQIADNRRTSLQTLLGTDSDLSGG